MEWKPGDCDLRDTVAWAIFRATFHDEEEVTTMARCWAEWPEDRERALRQADSVMSYVECSLPPLPEE